MQNTEAALFEVEVWAPECTWGPNIEAASHFRLESSRTFLSTLGVSNLV